MKINSEKILNDFKSFIDSSKKISEEHLVSFCFPLENFDPLVIIDELNKNYDDIFFFRVPENKYTVIGLNSALELSSIKDQNFISASEKITYWKNKVQKNWTEINFSSTKIIFCSTKFDPLKSSERWRDFEPLRIYIPEFVIHHHNNQTTGFFNFVLNDDVDLESVSNRLLHYLKIIGESTSETIFDYELRVISKLTTEKENLINWQDAFNNAMKFLNKGDVDKLVLSRIHSFTIDKSIDWTVLLRKLNKRFLDCYLFFIKRKTSVFFGSSPEMFLQVTEKKAEVESVAGSAPRGERLDTDNHYEKALQSSEKNHQEHLFVSNFISEILIQYSDNVRVIEEKQVRKLDNIQHLITRITAELDFKNNLFELIDSLFPTPAVCGVPKETAMRLIRELENYDRGLYSGLVGVMDFNGNCEFAVSIRSALVKDNIVNAFAGAGLVNTSNSDEEFMETELKLNTILSLFDNESKS